MRKQGPGATWSSGTLLPSIETSVEYAVKMMKKIQTETIKSIDVKQEALNDIYAHFDEFHKTTVWQECRSCFKDGKTKNRIYLWPGSVSSTPQFLSFMGLAPILRSGCARVLFRRKIMLVFRAGVLGHFSSLFVSIVIHARN
jgi:hypothetical protein